MQKERVGFIGMGNMGGRMGQCIMGSGTPLIGFDADVSKLKIPGLQAADSIEELAKNADIILMSLPNSNIIETVVRAENGLLSHVRQGQVVVDLSTANVSSSRSLYDDFAKKGVHFLDAGISGGAAGAEKCTLTLMVGGSLEALERVRWVLDLFSKEVFYMGESGAGHATKILNNFLNGISLSATAEVMVAARKFGLDLKVFLDVVNNSSGVNFATTNRFPYIIQGDYLEGGLTGKLMAKDLSLYVDFLKELGVLSLQGASCLNVFEIANALGYSDKISNRVVDAIGDLAGGIRLY